ncbi:hypothetical protein [Actinomadura kijaniata]|uniref:hypothetical protein n=1 Tax=Actinomadura kijaniata TaxID=46161 RepID=UPI000835A50A|nr:hypothetical protein [Actinomadura kijaniata]
MLDTAQASFFGLSLRNQALLLQQADQYGIQLTDVATPRQWHERGRRVRNEEFNRRPLWICVPIRGKDEDGQERLRFRSRQRYDICQTEPSPRPAPSDDASATVTTAQDRDDLPEGQLTEPADPLQTLVESLRGQVVQAGFAVVAGPAVEVDLDRKTLTAPDPVTTAMIGPLIDAVTQVITSPDRARAAAATGSSDRRGDGHVNDRRRSGAPAVERLTVL